MTVAENWPQGLWDKSHRRDATDYLFVERKAFEATMHARRNVGIGMAV
jgi:hypothetical protein